ncbi:MAG TPA: hypothetical protein VM509_11325 [Planctomycetota bacterium]|nr:hypothetical protein [Planctomycetota bacterium]
MRKLGEAEYVDYSDAVVLMPSDVKSIDGPDPEQSYIRSTLLQDLEVRARKLVTSQGAMLRAREWTSEHGKPLWSVAMWRDGSCECASAKGNVVGAKLPLDKDLWSAVESRNFLTWPDFEAPADSRQRIFTLEVLAQGRSRKIRLPDPTQPVARFSTEPSELIRAWLDLSGLSVAAEARTACALYSGLLEQAR